MAPRDRLAAILGQVAAPGALGARCTAPVDDLHLEVRGVGEIRLPVPDTQARQLCALGRQARYGRGERTLLDTRVRDTMEIPRSRVRIDKRRWNRTLLPALDRLSADLGLPPQSRLDAELHSMLVYGPRQFFVPHQDSEKADAMVGSLVVTLPSSFTGGTLVVMQGGATATYRTSRTSLSLVAFYADCRHEIRPVRTGYRIVLTYNLLLRGATAMPEVAEPAAEGTDEVARCVTEHFTTPAPSPSPVADRAAAVPPNRLVYLLDHEYTRRGLCWSRLKGTDARRAALLRAAATRADCDVVLALADVHETWSSLDADWERPWRPWPRSRRWDARDRWDEGDDDDEHAWPDGDETDEHELDELIDSAITLDSWIAPSGTEAEPVATSVGDAEVCSSTPSVSLQPYSTEYEGYMGNYGNTMDRWYHRGAVVLWPRERAFAVRGEASAAWALDALIEGCRGIDVTGAQKMAPTLAPFWGTAVGIEPKRGLFTKALRAARAIDHAALAAMLVEPFRLEMLAPGNAKAVAALLDRYGEHWAGDVLRTWSRHSRPWGASSGPGLLEWAASLGRLCDALHATGVVGTSTARLLLQDTWTWLSTAIAQRLEDPPTSRREEALGQLGRPIAAVLDGAASIGAAELRDDAVRFLCRQDDGVIACLTQILRAAVPLSPARRGAAGLDIVADDQRRRLEARLARPPRADDDWAIEFPSGCDCTLCDLLAGFLRDGARSSFEWPLAKEKRRHVHGRIDSAELPVDHQTRRRGSPYTLVLTKTDALFERERQARYREEADLKWLADHWSVGARASGR